MLFTFLLGFFFGAVAIVAFEGLALVWVLDRLRRKGAAKGSPETQAGGDLNGEPPVTFPCNKQGVIWILEPEKVPKVGIDESPTSSKEQKNKKNILEVLPVKKCARIKDHSLILSDLDGSQATIELLNCMVVAISASNLSSRKWAKRYPIKLESKDSVVYSGSKICYLYVDTSWEKESWCKALRLASSPDVEKLRWYSQLSDEFHNYLASLSAEYPSFLKPPALSSEAADKAERTDGSSKVRLFFKKLAKKASKVGLDSKASLTASSTRGERKIGDKLRSSHYASSVDGFLRNSVDNNLSNNSLQDLVQPTSPTSGHSDNKNSLHHISPDTVCDEKFAHDEGALCWNLLFSRLFFDAKRNFEINNAIKMRLQRTLSTMRTPSYIGEVTCTGLDLGTLPPYIHRMRVLPIDLNEMWAMELDIEYSGGVVLDIETRLEVGEPELQKEIMKTSSEPNSAGEMDSDLLDGFEHYGNQLKFSNNSDVQLEFIDEEEKVDGFKQSKNTGRTSGYMSRWKAFLHSIADQVSQVPLSLAIRISSLRGTLRLHIKPPPSDQLWYGFISMPEIELNLESSVGDRKITNSHIALLISNRFKAAIRDTLVLPNCGSICIPWMLAEKDDWAPRKVAPFIWLNQEAMDTQLDLPNSQSEEAKLNDGSNTNKAGPTAHTDDDRLEKVKNVVHVHSPQESPPKLPNSQDGPLSSVSSRSFSGRNEDLRIPLLRADDPLESCSQSKAESPKTSVLAMEEQTIIPQEEDTRQKKTGRRARMIDFGKRMGDKLEEKRRNLEEKSRSIVDRMRENSRT